MASEGPNTLVIISQHVGLTLMNINKTKIAICLGLILGCLFFVMFALRGTVSSTQELSPADQLLVDAGIPELPNAEVHLPATCLDDEEISKSVTTDCSIAETRDFYETTLEKDGWEYQQQGANQSNSYSNEFLKGDKVFMLSATPAQTNHNQTFIKISYRRASSSAPRSQMKRTRAIGFQ